MTDVVIASGDNAHLVDALSAGPLATLRGAPVLLTQERALPAATAAEIKRLGATRAYVIGTIDVIGTAVETALRAAGITTIVRLGGADRYATAVAVSREISPPGRALTMLVEEAGMVRDIQINVGKGRKKDAQVTDVVLPATSDVPTPVKTSTTTDPVGQTSGLWTLALDEQFLGTSLNTNLWTDHLIEGDAFRCNDNSAEVQWYPHDMRGVSVANGYCVLTARHEVAPDAPNPLPSGRAPAYTSGMIQSHPGFQMTYGYVETRFRCSAPDGTQRSDYVGNWPAWWAIAADARWGPEFDWTELYSDSGPVGDHNNYYSEAGSWVHTHTRDQPTPNEWHVYGFKWSATGCTWYVDGVQVDSYSGSITALPQHLIFNYAIRNTAVASNYPASVTIDYIRAWTPVGVPAAPTITSATSASSTSATVSFSAVSGATSYRVFACPVDAMADGVNTDRSAGTVQSTGAATTQTVTGLVTGVRYQFTVSAVNATGRSVESALSSVVTPGGGSATVPAAPVIGTPVAGNGAVTVAWTDGSDGGSAITMYYITPYAGATALAEHWWTPAETTLNGGVRSATYSGLTNGTVYTFKVQAENAVGRGPQSAASAAVTPTGTIVAPGIPTIGTASVLSATSVSVAFTPGSTGGEAPTYQALSTPGSLTGTSSQSPVTVSGLTTGTAYTFQVRASNSAGSSGYSGPSNSVTPAASAWPDATNTGPDPAGYTSRTPYTGSLPPAAGSVITAKTFSASQTFTLPANFTGTITFNGCEWFGAPFQFIEDNKGSTGHLIFNDCLFRGASSTSGPDRFVHSQTNTVGGSYQFYRCEFKWSGSDCVSMDNGRRLVMRDCYCHDTAGPFTDTHADVVEWYTEPSAQPDGSWTEIVHNSMWYTMPWNATGATDWSSAILGPANAGGSWGGQNVLIENNRLAGGTATLYQFTEWPAGGTPLHSNIVIRNNVFGTTQRDSRGPNQTHSPYYAWGVRGNIWEGNIWGPGQYYAEGSTVPAP